MQADSFASEVTALKEQVQAVEMAKQVQQANMDRDRAIEVAELKAQVQPPYATSPSFIAELL